MKTLLWLATLACAGCANYGEEIAPAYPYRGHAYYQWHYNCPTYVIRSHRVPFPPCVYMLPNSNSR